MRIHGDDGAVFTIESLLCGYLKGEIDGELEILAGNGQFLAKMAQLFTVAVHDNAPAAVFAAKQAIVGLLNTRPPDDVAGRVEGVAWIVEHLLGDLADVSDEV